MPPMNIRRLGNLAGILVTLLVSAVAAQESSAPATPRKPPLVIRTARTGHVTNYDETKVGTYALPDPLVFLNGEPVRDAAAWIDRRRPELLRLYEANVYGRVPSTAPVASVKKLGAGERVENGSAIRKHLVVHFGSDPAGPKVDVVLYVPAHASKPVPVLLQLVFARGLPSGAEELPLPPSVVKGLKPGQIFSETGPVAEILKRGYGYATFRYTDIQPDAKDSADRGVIALARNGAARKSDEWGAIAAWAWGTSRVLDALTAEPEVDAKRVALIGHSRLGKTVLWAGATDERFALVFSSCSGEMGAALSRRDFGETIDDMAENLPWQFTENFRSYAGRWKELPVDAHELIALSAPRPVFVTGGSEDLWADPKGEFLAESAAEPVYRLLGRPGLGAASVPPLDAALTQGSLGWLWHTGGHQISPSDWRAFLEFADRHLGK